MKIIDFASKSWFFLNDEQDYYIDVNCSYSYLGFNMLIKLSHSEADEYKNHGKVYLHSLAQDIQQYALSKYNERNTKGTIERLANEAVITFLEESK